MKTTKNYLHLAGVVFRDEAEALERRLLGNVSTGVSTDLANLRSPSKPKIAQSCGFVPQRPPAARSGISNWSTPEVFGSSRLGI